MCPRIPRYTAKARLIKADQTLQELTLALEIMPIRLDPVPDNMESSTHWSLRQEWAPSPDTGYHGLAVRRDPTQARAWALTMRDRLHERVAAEFRLMKRYGLNCVYERALPEAVQCR
jgi:hypothetical protein